MTAMNATIRFWDRIAKSYEAKPIKNQQAYERKLEITKQYCQPTSRLLEVGCGTGKTAVKLAPFVQSVDATDFANNMIELGRRYAEESGVTNVTFKTEDALAVPGQDRYDVVLAHSLMHLLQDPDAFLLKVRDVLTDDGVFISNTVCLGDIANFLKPVAALGRMLGLLPRLTFFSHEQHLASLERTGFEVLECWQPEKGTSFIVAKPRAQ